MTEDIIFKRRNKLRKHFVNTSNVLLYEYKKLSSEAKITFQVIESFDWEDKETGDSKGYVFPAIVTLADIRGTSERTIYRHIKDLEIVGLLTRQRRSHKASFIFIEDVSEEEANKYLDKYVNKAKWRTSFVNPTAKNGNSPTASQLTKMSVDYMKENEDKKEYEINVNEFSNKKRSGNGMMSIQRVLEQYDRDKHNRSKNKARLIKLQPETREKRDYYAQEIADTLGDQKSLGCYRTIAEKVPEGVIFQILASIKETWQEGKIKQSRGALFVDIIKQYAQNHNIELGFSI